MSVEVAAHEVRLMTMADAAELRKQLAGCGEPARVWPDFEREITDLPFSHPMVALQDGVPVGYLVAWYIADELEIIDLYVQPHFRRMGIARELLAATERLGCRFGCRQAHLEVSASNVPAIALYQHAGFLNVGIRRQYYRAAGEDAILMTKTLE